MRGVVEAIVSRWEEEGAVRILIAIAPRMYGEVLAYALQKNRPAVEVVRVAPEDLDGELEGFDDQLVVCNEATDRVKAIAPSWVALTYARGINASVCLGGRRSTIEDVGVEDMLTVKDEAERLSAAT